MSLVTEAKTRVLDCLSENRGLSFEKLRLETLTKDGTLHRAITELLTEDRIYRRKIKRRYFYFLQP